MASALSAPAQDPSVVRQVLRDQSFRSLHAAVPADASRRTAPEEWGMATLLPTADPQRVGPRNADPNQLDSVYLYGYDSLNGIWFPRQRTIHLYDAAGRRTETRRHIRAMNGAGWKAELWILFSYDAQGREVNRLTSRWSDFFSTWQPALSDSTEYDDLGRPVRYRQQAWHFATSTWHHTYQQLLQYDPEGRVRHRTEQQWDNNAWRNHHREQFSYQLPADTLEILTERPDPLDNAEWIPEIRIEFVYGSNGLLLEKAHNRWEATSGWVLRQRQQFQYEGSALTGAVDFLQEPGGWYPYRRERYQYGTGGWLAEITAQQWDPFIGDWRNTFREHRTPDDQGRLQTRHLFPWEPTAFGLLNKARTLLSYNQNGDTVQLLTQHWNDLTHQWTLAWREQRKHNGNGQTSVSTMVRWDPSAGQWVFEARMLLHYLPGGQPDEVRYQRWHPNGQTWADTYRLSYEYNQQGQRSADVFYAKTPDGDWHPLVRSLYEYHPNGRTALFRHQLYQEGSGWTNEYQHAYSYNSEDLLSEDLMSAWDPDNQAWQARERTLYLYGPSGWITQRTQQRMYLDWVNEHRTLFLYDPDGLLLEELRQEWVPTLFAWRNEHRNNHQYNLSGVLLQQHRSRWNIVADNWESAEKTDYMYNASQQLVGSTTSRWDGDGVGWTATDATLLQYDGQGHATEWLSQRRGPQQWAWVPYLQEEYFWADPLSATDPATSAHLSAACNCRHANPYRSGGPIRCEGLTEGPWEILLYNGSGTMVYRQTLQAAEDFTIRSELPPGFYLLVIRQAGRQAYRGKMVVAR